MEAIEIWLSKQVYPLELETRVHEDYTIMEKVISYDIFL